jgi:hypothetical protein
MSEAAAGKQFLAAFGSDVGERKKQEGKSARCGKRRSKDQAVDRDKKADPQSLSSLIDVSGAERQAL